MVKPSIPKGTRDFSPKEMIKRNYIFDTIRQVFQRFGYLPLETPSMENSSTLMGKYGEEGDKLIFKILNSGDFLDGVDEKLVDLKDSKKLTPSISEKALRYDLTVPFARYVVMHKNDITFPFKRYQIQPVWRADRPQKGRYREFYQCDADIIGSDSLLNEYELILVIDEVFSKLGLKVLIQINNRKILSGVAELMQMPERIIDLTVAIDKLDKIGVEKVEEELSNKGFTNEALNKLRPLFNLHGSNNDKLNSLESLLSTSEVGLLGIAEVRRMLSFVINSELNSCKLELEITLARGLNYYTGAIFEVKVADERSSFTSSICGGGRYDDLTGIFGLPNMSGVGISFGADRIYDVLEEAKLFKDDAFVSTKVLVINFGGDDLSYALKITSLLRSAEVNTELYPDDAKIKKQMGYADSLAIPFVIIAGSDERNANEVTIKDMRKGEQTKIAFAELVNYIKNN